MVIPRMCFRTEDASALLPHRTCRCTKLQAGARGTELPAIDIDCSRHEFQYKEWYKLLQVSLSLTLRHLHKYPSMPKETKSEPLFCCGELHKSANYHKRTAHQKYTKIYFKHHPNATFVLKRNPKTRLFHCPQCDKSWAMATPVRNHIFQRCEGYVKYRSPIPGTKDNATKGGQPAQVKDEDVDPAMDGNTADAAEETPDGKETNAVNKSPVVRSPVHPTPDLASGGHPTTTPEPAPPAPSPSTPSDSSPGQPGACVTAHLFPLLRPALWSPVNLTNGIGMDASDSRPSVPSLPPSLTGSLSSCSSIFSVRTWPDDQPPGVPVPSPRFKAEGDLHNLNSASSSSSGSGFGSGLLFGPRTIQIIDRPPSAARLFLDSLRRPLGHAARHLHALGVVSEADLDLICTMPDAWDELGELLTRGGVTVIEWLMVKEAFKARARQVTAVV
ncbi:hypothetical protein LXA43DRAFT_279528 [Ganoderma leucocontextum]|nr:hypothetical protein LXA43DRAFT_279528 [Ganoderma leucocontextum]